MPTPQHPASDQLAALADVIVDLAHQLDIRNPKLRDVVPLTGTEMAIMREVHRNPGITPSQLSEMTGLHRSNISTAVRTLETGGLLERTPAPGDARSITLTPTDLAAASVARINEYWVSRFDDIPSDALADAVGVLGSLQRIAAALESE